MINYLYGCFIWCFIIDVVELFFENETYEESHVGDWYKVIKGNAEITNIYIEWISISFIYDWWIVLYELYE